MSTETANTVIEKINNYSKEFKSDINETAVILAAGHGKRIKSQTSKMLHKIWGKPTVNRVHEACADGLNEANIVVVVGIKATEVIDVFGKQDLTQFAYQQEQNGTGHAVQIGLEKVAANYNGTVYVLPGDMGLINEKTMQMFKERFYESDADMMVLTGLYEGDPASNHYGRIVRVKENDSNGNSSGADKGHVLAIVEYKDILGLADKTLDLSYNGKTYAYTQTELLENNEFNSGVFAFNHKYLQEEILKIKSDNAQNEIYITDLIELFNKRGLKVGAVSPIQQFVLMGFNNKSVLKKMDAIARNMQYEKIKDIIEIDDPEDFFIADDVIEQILSLDKNGKPLDIKIGKGVSIEAGVKLNYNSTIMKNAVIRGNINLGENVIIWDNVQISCYEEQELIIKNNVEILSGNLIKGNTIIDENSVIESRVNITGNDLYPTRIGKNVTLKGTSYIFGSTIDDGAFIEHSVIVKKRVEKMTKKDGTVQKIRFYLPMPEGIDSIEEL